MIARKLFGRGCAREVNLNYEVRTKIIRTSAKIASKLIKIKRKLQSKCLLYDSSLPSYTMGRFWSDMPDFHLVLDLFS